MPSDYWQTLRLTLALAACTTVLLLLLGLPLAYGLARSRSRLRPLLEAVVSLPLVLPPTVIGFYLLLAFSDSTALGRFLINQLGLSLNFTFAGILAGSLVYSLPFMVQPLQAGFRQLPRSLAEAAATLGKSRGTTLWRVLLPNMKPALLNGAVLTFAHTLGEFGVVLMIGGNLPGRTRVASIAIYDEVESLNYGQANAYALTLLVVAFAILVALYWFSKRDARLS
ncbi:molybdate ABC transporter permease subunit [Hymenobacter sp. UV11]|uniref:molybdate ABC transporter permease subunit n=1 Tax=Hymenobacter sp. UV11 TaxID=1849735 RepID=UPI00106153BC|nr:molybdate ABC transporter permease subunit [Hymenobacter sp. UV11]TDN37309.1 molybdenum ABC transporter permease subunit [Hymenobacter sp. UV11]TFZ68497.1 molybdate ABC transporter permease subunit [Hymenobacter sp. UV11]